MEESKADKMARERAQAALDKLAEAEKEKAKKPKVNPKAK